MTVLALFLACFSRGYILLGTAGAGIFATLAIAASCLFFMLVMRWRQSNWFRRSIGILLLALPIAQIVFPQWLITDYEHRMLIGHRERLCDQLRWELQSDKRFRNVRTDLIVGKGGFLRVSGTVETIEDRKKLESVIAAHNIWQVEWDVSTHAR